MRGGGFHGKNGSAWVSVRHCELPAPGLRHHRVTAPQPPSHE
jgi:hypothetical protein